MSGANGDPDRKPNNLVVAARLRLSSPSGSGRPMSRQELADMVNLYLYAHDPSDVGIDANYVGKVETGRNRWPGRLRREAFRHVLGARTDAELGFYIVRKTRGHQPQRSTEALRLTIMSGPAHDAQSWNAGDIDRRTLLRTAIGAAAGLPAASLTLDDLRHLAAALEDAHRYLDGDVVEALRRRLAECAQDDGDRGPRATLPAVLAVVGVIEQHSRQVKPAIRRQLLSLGAHGAEFAGWLYRDAGIAHLADYWRDRATEWAHEAGDLAMPGYVLLKKSQSAWDERDGLRMLTLAQAAQDGPWQLPTRVRAEAAQQEARGHAMVTRDLDMAERKLDQARELLDHDGGTGGLALHYDQTLLGVQSAMCYREAGKTDQAIELYQQWLSPSIFSRRDYGYFLALLAETHAAAGNPDAAAATGIEALSTATVTDSVRTLNELRRLQVRLTAWEQRPAVRDFCDAMAP